MGSVLDQQIAEAFMPYNPGNFFGAWGDLWARATFTIPLWIIAILLLNQWRMRVDEPISQLTKNLILAFIAIGFLVIVSVPVFKGADGTRWLVWGLSLILYLLTYSFCYWYFNRPSQLQKIRTGQYRLQTLLTIVLYMAALYISVALLKLIFQRPRMLAGVGYQEWWAVDWSDFSITGNSFPSGHTAMVMGLLPLLFLLRPRTRRYFIFGVVFWALIGIVGFSRMVYCRHYLTDVIATMIVGGAWWYVAKIVNRQNWLLPWEVKFEESKKNLLRKKMTK